MERKEFRGLIPAGIAVAGLVLLPAAAFAKDAKSATLKPGNGNLPRPSDHAQAVSADKFDRERAESEANYLAGAEQELLKQIKSDRERRAAAQANELAARSRAEAELSHRLKEEIEGRQMLAGQQEKLISEILRLKSKVRTLEAQSASAVENEFREREQELHEELRKERARAAKLEQAVKESRASLKDERVEKGREARINAELQSERARAVKLQQELKEVKVKLDAAEMEIRKTEELKAAYRQTRNAAEQLQLQLQAKGSVESDNQFVRSEMKNLEAERDKFKIAALKQRQHTEALEEKYRGAEKHVERLIDENKQLRNQLDERQKVEAEAAEQYHEVSKSNAALIAKVSELEKVIADKNQKLAAAMSYGSDIEKLREAIKLREDKLIEVARAKQALERLVAEMQAKVDTASKESSAMQAQLDESAKNLHQRDEEITELKRQLSKTIEETRVCSMTVDEKDRRLAELPELEKALALSKRETELKEQDIKVCHSQLEQSRQLVAGMQEVRKQLVEAKNELLLKETALGILGNEQDSAEAGAAKPAAAARPARPAAAPGARAGLSPEVGAAIARSAQAGLLTPPAQAPAAAARPQPAVSAAASDVMIVEIKSSKVNLRSGPGSEHSPLMQVQRGTRLTVEDRQGDWYRVFTPTGARAFVRADVVKVVDNGAAATKVAAVPAYDPASVAPAQTNRRAPSQPAARAGSSMSGEQVVPFGSVKIGGRSGSSDIEDVAFERLRKGIAAAK